jgi:hypothetical protein
MWMHGLGSPLLRAAPYVFVGISSDPSGRLFHFQSDFDKYSEALAFVAKKDGFVFQSEQVIKTDYIVALCLEFRSRQQFPEVNIRCVVDNTPILFFYRGDPNYRSDFYQMLKGISLEKAKSS